jgi:GTP pyrophosphokinase
LAGARGLTSAEELLIRVGEGSLSAAAVANAALPPPTSIPPELVGLPDYAPYVALAGGSHIDVNMAGCCRPTPPGPIAGYATNRGVVSIHRADCAVIRRATTKGRRVEARWRFDEEEAARGGTLELALVNEARWLPEVLRRVKRSGLRIVGVNSGQGGGVRPITVHVRLATASRMRRALQDVRALAAVTDAGYSLFKL